MLTRTLLRSPVALLILLPPLFLASSAGGATFTVCESGCDYSSIQVAHNAVPAGSTLDILGDLTEKGIVVSKDIHLTSSLGTPPIIQAAAEPYVADDLVFYISSGLSVSMHNLVIRHGRKVHGDGFGGGILCFSDITLSKVRLERNQARWGGGMFFQATGAVANILECTFESNRVDVDGGGLYADVGTVDIDRSTFAKNRAFEGGGIMNRGASTLTMNNSTVTMNRAPNGGAGIFNESGGTVNVTNSTFSLNSLRAIQNNDATSTFTIRNSVLANSLTATFEDGGTDCEVFLGGTITDQGFNLVESPGSCSFPSSTTGVDPGLCALADYGGPTWTDALNVNSGALGTGDAGTSTMDQRQIPRPQSTNDDVGAFEFRTTGEFLRPPAFCAPVAANGEIHYVEFKAYDVRGPNFNVQIQNGGLSSFSPDYYSHATYLGTLEEAPGAIAGATYRPLTGEYYYHVVFEDGTEWINEGSTTVVKSGSLGTDWIQVVPGTGGAGSAVWGTEVGVDLPNARYVSSHASDPNDALAWIEHSILATNLIYLRQVGVKHRLGRVIIRGSAGEDPYAPHSTHTQFLDEVTDQWTNILPPDTYDLALVVRAGSGAGQAALGAVATGHSSNDATPNGDFSLVWRHEAGHNWFLDHFDGGAPEGPTINSGNSIARMSGPEQALVTWYRDEKVADLDNLGSFWCPMPPSAGSDRAFVSAQLPSMLIDVLDNDHDANGDGLTLVSITPTTEMDLGGSMVLAPGQGSGGRDAVRYFPPVVGGPTTARDLFSYRIRDAAGLEAVGYVHVRLTNFDPSGIYAQDFNGFANGTQELNDGSYIVERGTGVAHVQNQVLQLVPDALWSQSSFTMPVSDLEDGYSATFRYKMSAAGSPADGFILNFGDPNITRLSAVGVATIRRGLSVEWVTWAGVPRGYHVRVDGVDVPGGYVADPGLADGTWHDVHASWNPSTGLILRVDGAIIFGNLPTPGFTPNAGDVLAFAARTGGLSSEILIDDVVCGARNQTGVPGNGPVPAHTALLQNIPNPFSSVSTTEIRFNLAKDGPVSLRIYDISGREIRTLVSEEMVAGYDRRVSWNGLNNNGQRVANGVYLYHLVTREHTETRKMTVIR